MSDTRDTLEVVDSVDSKCLEESQEDSMKIRGKDERTRKVIRNIRELDVSIRELELQLKILREESMNLQLKNSEELKNKLAAEPPENGTLAKNTRRFLDLCAVEEAKEKLSLNSHESYDKDVRSSKLQCEKEPRESLSITDEEKRRIEFLTSETADSAKEAKSDGVDVFTDLQAALNPYSIDESSKQLLEELEDKLKKNAKSQ